MIRALGSAKALTLSLAASKERGMEAALARCNKSNTGGRMKFQSLS